jgi:hypothetical protein
MKSIIKAHRRPVAVVFVSLCCVQAHRRLWRFMPSPCGSFHAGQNVAVSCDIAPADPECQGPAHALTQPEIGHV